MIEFCPKCGILLTKKGDKFVCVKCKYEKGNIKIETKEKIPEKKAIPILKGDEQAALPVQKGECPKCGHDKVFFWSRQTRASDEPETCFFKCVKCGHTWRQYT
jgi:DNA-directed RNA polymerase subunit M